MTYAYKRGKDNPAFVPFTYHLHRGDKLEKGSIVKIENKPLVVKRITSIEVIASGARVMGRGLPK